MGFNLLYANDKKGQYPQSYYAATANELPSFPALDGDKTTDVCVIGGGFTGLSTALHLAEAGVSVTLLEAHRVGFGASGRNGGQLGSGQRQDQETLEKMVGFDAAKVFWDLAEDSKDLVKHLVAKHKIDCALKSGVAWTATSKSEAQHMHGYADHLAKHYDYHEIEKLDQEACFELCPSPAYKGGMLDMGAGHLHPLNFALGLAKAADAAGADIHENTRVDFVQKGDKVRIKTETGTITANTLVLACNGYLGGLEPKVAARVMPINNFVAATEPLGDRISEVLNRDVAVADDLFVVNYFRLSEDKRLLFGGGESYGYRFPKDIAAKVRKPMLEIYPHLKDVRIDYAWGGTLGITMKRLPHVARIDKNILSGAGFSGHGVGTATHTGQLMAQAILGQSNGFDTMSTLPTPAFPGGSALRSPLLVLAMTWFSMRDRLGL